MKGSAYVGLDIHKKTVAWCAKDARGRILGEGTIGATRQELAAWCAARRRPWIGAMEATLFTGWIYDFLKPHARELMVAHPFRLRAIATAKTKNDKVDAALLADLVRCDLVPCCVMAAPEIRELRRVLRYRRLAVEQMVKMKNKSAGLLMEVGAPYNKKRLHGRKYFTALLEQLGGDLPDSVRELLGLSRQAMELFRDTSRRLMAALREHPLLTQRVERLMTIPAVGEVTALTWALEIGDPARFGSIARAISYCGLCSAQRESAGQSHRGPISKQRNRHLQSVLVEAAKLGPRLSPQLAQLHARELARGGRNRATLAVARRLVAWLLAVDKRSTPFQAQTPAGAQQKDNEFSDPTMDGNANAPQARAIGAGGAGSHGADVALQQSAAPLSVRRGVHGGKHKIQPATRRKAG
jgi:transposase